MPYYRGCLSGVWSILNGEKDSGNLLTFKNIEILNKNDGAPYVNILDDIMVDCFYRDVKISISHIKKYATATAISINHSINP